MGRLPLGSIEAFVVVARSLSLTKAAASMNLTVPALSRRIQILEHHLGGQLFRRLPRGLSLTEAGAAYFAALAPAWDIVGTATEAARIRTRGKAIRLSVMPTFAANWLMPRLVQFHVRHPGIDVELETSGDLVDLSARPDLDCAIRLGKGRWPGLVSQPLLPVDAYPVACPGFLGDDPPLQHPQDLLRYPLIGTDHQPEFWGEWFGDVPVDAARCRYRGFDNLQLVYEAAAARMGIAIGLDPVVRPYLESGRLQRLLPSDVRLSRSFHLVRRQGESLSGGAWQVFRDWLFREARAYGGDAEA
jgi:LysR family glycine cleavage system transcriptional activator